MPLVLAALDFSPASDAALERAAHFARALSAEVELLHVAAPDPAFVGFEAGPKSVRDTRAHELRDEHRELQARAERLRGQGLEARAILVEGHTVDTIVERAESLEADLIVLGSHGRSAVARLLLGSVSEGVLRRARVPVLIVPARGTASGSA